MAKYITRTFHVHEGKKMLPDYESMKFVELPTTLIDCDERPENFVPDREYNCKVRMPVETFFHSGERVEINK